MLFIDFDQADDIESIVRQAKCLAKDSNHSVTISYRKEAVVVHADSDVYRLCIEWLIKYRDQLAGQGLATVIPISTVERQFEVELDESENGRDIVDKDGVDPIFLLSVSAITEGGTSEAQVFDVSVRVNAKSDFEQLHHMWCDARMLPDAKSISLGPCEISECDEYSDYDTNLISRVIEGSQTVLDYRAAGEEVEDAEDNS